MGAKEDNLKISKRNADIYQRREIQLSFLGEGYSKACRTLVKFWEDERAYDEDASESILCCLTAAVTTLIGYPDTRNDVWIKAKEDLRAVLKTVNTYGAPYFLTNKGQRDRLDYLIKQFNKATKQVTYTVTSTRPGLHKRAIDMIRSGEQSETDFSENWRERKRVKIDEDPDYICDSGSDGSSDSDISEVTPDASEAQAQVQEIKQEDTDYDSQFDFTDTDSSSSNSVGTVIAPLTYSMATEEQVQPVAQTEMETVQSPDFSAEAMARHLLELDMEDMRAQEAAGVSEKVSLDLAENDNQSEAGLTDFIGQMGEEDCPRFSTPLELSNLGLAERNAISDLFPDLSAYFDDVTSQIGSGYNLTSELQSLTILEPVVESQSEALQVHEHEDAAAVETQPEDSVMQVQDQEDVEKPSEIAAQLPTQPETHEVVDARNSLIEAPRLESSQLDNTKASIRTEPTAPVQTLHHEDGEILETAPIAPVQMTDRECGEILPDLEDGELPMIPVHYKGGEILPELEHGELLVMPVEMSYGKMHPSRLAQLELPKSELSVAKDIAGIDPDSEGLYLHDMDDYDEDHERDIAQHFQTTARKIQSGPPQSAASGQDCSNSSESMIEIYRQLVPSQVEGEVVIEFNLDKATMQEVKNWVSSASSGGSEKGALCVEVVCHKSTVSDFLLKNKSYITPEIIHLSTCWPTSTEDIVLLTVNGKTEFVICPRMKSPKIPFIDISRQISLGLNTVKIFHSCSVDTLQFAVAVLKPTGPVVARQVTERSLEKQSQRMAFLKSLDAWQTTSSKEGSGEVNRQI